MIKDRDLPRQPGRLMLIQPNEEVARLNLRLVKHLFRRVLLESDRLSTQWLSPPKLTLSGCESGRPSCDNAA
jgi:hypothetical protein